MGWSLSFYVILQHEPMFWCNLNVPSALSTKQFCRSTLRWCESGILLPRLCGFGSYQSFFPDLDPILQNDPLRLPPFHFDADPDPQHCYDGFVLFRYLIVYILLGLHGDGEDSWFRTPYHHRGSKGTKPIQFKHQGRCPSAKTLIKTKLNH